MWQRRCPMKVGPIHACVNGEAAYNGRAFAVRGDVYYRYDWTPDMAALQYPLPLARWKLPGTFGMGFDAALRGAWIYKGMAYFFKGPHYVAFSWKNDAPTGDSPRSISAWGLTGAFASGIDAAVNGEGPMAGKALFTRGSQYVVYDWAADKIEGKPAPLKKLGFPGGFAVGVDAVAPGYGQYEGYAYFFRGDK